VVEAALMMPWLAFLFVGVLDFGFYSYAAICTQNAARAAAIATAASSTSQTNLNACTAALRELKGLPNMSGIATCQTSAGAVNGTNPVAAFVIVLDCNSTPTCADCTATACAATPPPALPTSAQASVTYQTIPMIPIPGVLTAQLTLTRICEMRIILQ
jgi:Flp pilus assembly protein TadG